MPEATVDASLTTMSMKTVSFVQEDLVDIVKFQRSMLQNSVENGKLTNLEEQKLKAPESSTNGISKCSGTFCCVVSFLIIVTNLSVCIHILYRDI